MKTRKQVIMKSWDTLGIYVDREFHYKTARWWVKHESEVPTDIYIDKYGATTLEASTEKQGGIMYQIVDGKLKFVW